MTDEHYIRRCFDLARRGLGHTAANPIVGAVLVHNDRIIGEGWHHAWGGPHAEVECLQNVLQEDRALIRESTMYVSLEPCAHQGKQPPCADRLVAEGIRKVVVSVDDPNLQVSGRGYGILEAAGVEVVRGIQEGEGRWQARRFLSLHEQTRPYVILKWAQSADGFIAPADGERTQLSNSISQRIVHKWRTEEAAILVGYRTALLDNPRLTARHWRGPQPLRIVLDRTASLPRTHHLFDEEAPTWLVTESADAVLPPHVRIVPLTFDEALLQNLYSVLHLSGISSLSIEGGKATLDAVFSAGIWDEARVFHTPVVLGGGVPAPKMTDALPALRTIVGADDVLQTYVRSGTRYPYPAWAPL